MVVRLHRRARRRDYAAPAGGTEQEGVKVITITPEAGTVERAEAEWFLSTSI